MNLTVQPSTKESLRQNYLRRRQSLSEPEYKSACSTIALRFFDYVDFKGMCVLHSFLPIPSKREPDTIHIIHKVLNADTDIRIAVPVIDRVRNTLVSIHYRGQALRTNKWNISEPEYGETICPKEIDMVIVPLLAFDKRGHRVGYGKGYYDRFLSTCRPDCRKLGLSFFPPVSTGIPADGWDVRLDSCITPEQTYSFA